MLVLHASERRYPVEFLLPLPVVGTERGEPSLERRGMVELGEVGELVQDDVLSEPLREGDQLPVERQAPVSGAVAPVLHLSHVRPPVLHIERPREPFELRDHISRGLLQEPPSHELPDPGPLARPDGHLLPYRVVEELLLLLALLEDQLQLLPIEHHVVVVEDPPAPGQLLIVLDYPCLPVPYRRGEVYVPSPREDDLER